MTERTEAETNLYTPVPEEVKARAGTDADRWAEELCREMQRRGFAQVDPIWLCYWIRTIYDVAYDEGLADGKPGRPHSPGGD